MNKEKLKLIENMKFELIDPIEFSPHEKKHYRVSEYDLEGMPSTYEENQAELRERVIEIYEKVFEGKKTLVYEKCDIDRTNFGRFIKGTYGITKSNLVKFIICAKLSHGEATELLILNETPLYPTKCRFDYIADLAITDEDDIDDFMEELVKYGCKNIASKSVL